MKYELLPLAALLILFLLSAPLYGMEGLGTPFLGSESGFY